MSGPAASGAPGPHRLHGRLQAEGCLSHPIRLHHHSVYSGATDGACGTTAGKYQPARGPDRSNCGLSESQPFRAALPPQHRAEPGSVPGVLPPTGSRVREHAGPKKPGGRKKDSRFIKKGGRRHSSGGLLFCVPHGAAGAVIPVASPRPAPGPEQTGGRGRPGPSAHRGSLVERSVSGPPPTI